MRTILKYATAVVLTGAVAMAAASPSEARNWRHGGSHHGGWNNGGAVIGGLAAGALLGAAVAGAANSGYYGSGYYGYADGPGYAPGYAYGPGYGYGAPSPYYRYGNPYRDSCAIDMGYGRLDYSSC